MRKKISPEKCALEFGGASHDVTENEERIFFKKYVKSARERARSLFGPSLPELSGSDS